MIQRAATSDPQSSRLDVTRSTMYRALMGPLVMVGGGAWGGAGGVGGNVETSSLPTNSNRLGAAAMLAMPLSVFGVARDTMACCAPIALGTIVFSANIW